MEGESGREGERTKGRKRKRERDRDKETELRQSIGTSAEASILSIWKAKGVEDSVKQAAG
eukprot:3487032-Pleurochrysis_carterae.AAC.3